MSEKISEGRRILVTGGCGFIASNFINDHFEKYPEDHIINVDAMYYCASIENVAKHVRESERYTFVKGNLQNREIIDFVFDNFHIDHVIHFAAQSHVDNSFSNPLQYTLDNIVATHNLLEAVKQRMSTIKRFIHVSTDEVYGESMLNDDGTMKKDETSTLDPTNPYAATKAAAEMIAKSYYHSFRLPVIITRGNNVYGPNQYPEKLIPRFIKLLKEGKKVTIQGDGSNVRGFIHVSDVVRGFECILDKGVVGNVYNIGTDESEEYSVMEIARMLIGKIHGEENQNQYIEYIPDRPFNDKRYYISNQKLKDLGWDIQKDFQEGIDELVRG